MGIKKPKFRSMNFAICDKMLERYKDSDDLCCSYQKCGLNGLEVIRAGVSGEGKILPGMVNGVHLYFHVFWLDWWRGNKEWLDAEFDSREQWIEYYGGEDRDSYLKCLRDDLAYAEEVGAKYVVFHVSEGSLRESFIYQHRYSDEEVIDASLEIINTLLSEREYSFDFLVENLWWSGLTLKDVKKTKRMIEGICSEKKGIMLDTGHYMNTNFNLHTPKEAVQYLNEMLDAHERERLLPWFQGMHLQMSLSGEYVRQQQQEWPAFAEVFENMPFYERFRVSYEHVEKVDLHQPFLAEGVKELVERVSPRYLTIELRQNNRKEYEEAVTLQNRLLFSHI